MSPSRASARAVSEGMRTPILSLGATSSSIACMIEGTTAITITLPIQKPGAPATLLRMRSAPLGMRVMRRRVSLILAPVVFTIRAGWRERADRCRSNAFAAIGGDVTVGRPDPASGEDIGAAPGWTIREIPFCGDRAPVKGGWTIQAAEITNRWAQPPGPTKVKNTEKIAP